MYLIGRLRTLLSYVGYFSRKKTNQSLYFVHIGKCGGSSLRQAVKNSRVVKNWFTKVKRFHFEQPTYRADVKYLFAVRNPISRARSAFYYRKALLDGGGEEKISGELSVFTRYATFCDLAESLYVEGVLNESAVADWNSIHHLGDETIGFYLRPLLPVLRKKDIFGVVSVENFDSDCQAVLGVKPPAKRRFGQRFSGRELELSALAVRNLRRFLDEEFSLLNTLFEVADIPLRLRNQILNFH